MNIKQSMLTLLFLDGLFAGHIAMAQASDIFLEEIVVKGERVERSLKETSSSVAVTSGEKLDGWAATQRIESILSFTPNITQLNGSQAPSIRGNDGLGAFSTNGAAALSGTRPRTTIVVDGRAQNQSELLYATASLYDVSTVEVYRGPQTTTQGRNASAGAVFINTAEPAYEWQGTGRVLFGESSAEQLSGMLSGPIVDDQLAFRIVADHRDSEWHISPSPSARDFGLALGADDYSSFRGKLLLEPNALPGLRAKIIFNHLNAINPQTDWARSPFSNLLNDRAFFIMMETEVDAWTFDVDYEIGGGFSVQALVTTYQSDLRRVTDVPDFPSTIREEEIAGELFVRYKGQSRLQGIIGISAVDNKTNTRIINFANPLGDILDDDADSLGLFGELTYSLTDRLAIAAGARFQRDDQARSGQLFGGLVPVDFSVDEDTILPKLTLTYDLTPDVRFGLSAVKGYNPGGVSILIENVLFGGNPLLAYESEDLWNYEFFARASLWDQRLGVNANFFFTNYENPQRGFTSLFNLPPFLGSAPFLEGFTLNADSASAYGAEIEIRFLATEYLSLLIGLGILETEIDRFDDPTGTNLVGNEFARAPALTATAGVEWQPLERLFLSVQARYSSSYFSEDFNIADRKVDSYLVADARAGLNLTPSIELFGYITNLTDELGPIGFLSTTTAYLNRPREFGVGVSFNFF